MTMTCQVPEEIAARDAFHEARRQFANAPCVTTAFGVCASYRRFVLSLGHPNELVAALEARFAEMIEYELAHRLAAA